MKKLMMVFAGVLAAAAVIAVVSGCFNPVQPRERILSSADGTSTDGTFTNGTFTVTLGVGGEGPDGARAVVGPNDYGITYSDIRNIAQVIVIRADTGEVANFVQLLQKNSKDTNKKFTVTDLMIGGGIKYHFLVLMGHRERDYAAESNPAVEYKYRGGSPTLLAAGLREDYEITDGTSLIKIEMHPLVVDTVFRQGETVVEAALPSAQPGGAWLLPGIDAEVVWTLTGGFAELLKAQGKIGEGGGVDTVWGEEPDFLPNSTKKVWFRIGAGSPPRRFCPHERGGQDYPEAVGESGGAAGSAWFNITYLPFGAGNKKVFTDIDPNATEWIIRNGVNDKAQDGKTVFRKDSTPVRPWNDQDGEDGSNGNGAVAFKVIQTKEIDLTDVVPAPAAGAVPETAPREGYGGTVDWTLNEGKSTVRFDAETVYIAKVTLTPPAGAQFSGSGVTVSHRGGAVTVDPSSSATEVKVVVVFKATGALAYEAPFFSGSPSTLGDSVIDLIKKAKTESSGFLSLKLTSWDAETVNLDAAGTDIGAGLALTAADNSPPKVTIDGGGKEIALGSGNGSVITVGAGVTLTLKNITFKGTSGNTKPFIKVAAGGKLILEDGAVIKDNGKSGVLISGSNSVVEMYDGVRIEKNGQSGVAAERGGSFTMNGGTISGNTIANGGGGVDVFDGTFIKTGGIIYGNDVGAPLANTSNSSNAFKSHAVYFSFGITVKRRAGTAGEDVRLNGSTDEGWDIH